MNKSSEHIAQIRQDYRMASLDEEQAGDNPVSFFLKWFAQAEEAGVTEVNAMTLATVDAQHRPHARIVLLKGIEEDGFVFYTNYQSAKGRQIANNAHAALVFFWKEIERQVRIEGILDKVSATASDEYFAMRPKGSQIGAIASPQSQRINDRAVLERNIALLEEKFANKPVERPTHWGGYRLQPTLIEFWQGRSSRLHDRIIFEKEQDKWLRYRVAP
jgi:pyridoxamine 5'-phosphate oxidase